MKPYAKESQSVAGMARTAGQCEVRRHMAWLARQGRARRGSEGRGVAGDASRGCASFGTAWHRWRDAEGWARRGEVIMSEQGEFDLEQQDNIDRVRSRIGKAAR